MIYERYIIIKTLLNFTIKNIKKLYYYVSGTNTYTQFSYYSLAHDNLI